MERERQAVVGGVGVVGKVAARIGWLVVAAGCAMAPAWTALGQHALGDGRNLERNTGNTPLPPSRTRNESFRAQMKLNDSIITGNATGGAAFRGNAGYRAADDFRSRLGSDDTFRFQRDSLQRPSWAQPGTDSLRYQLDRQTALRRMGSDIDGMLGRGNTGRPTPSGVPKPVDDENERFNLGIGNGAVRSTAAYQLGRALSPSSVGRFDDRNGTITNTYASGLRGLTVQNNRRGLNDKINPLAEANKVNLYAGQRTTYDELKERLSRLDLGPAERPLTTGDLDRVLRPGQIDTRVPSDLTPATDRGVDKGLDRGTVRQGEGADRPGAQPGGPGSSPERPGDSPLPDPVRPAGSDVSPNLPSTVSRPGANLPGESVRPRDPVTGLPTAQAGGEAWRGRMAEIRKALNESEKAKNEAKSRKQRGLKTGESDDPRTPEERSRREAVQGLNRDTIRAIRDSGGTVDKFVSTLSPGGEDRDIYTELMLTGQKYLAEGRYFDAEERFIRAAVLRPDDATALVGRLHSQLGAGMVLSASMNLRQIIREHPELIGVKYAPALMPSASRLASLQQDLDLTITPLFAERLDLRARCEAALLKAYVGFQQSDRAMIANSLRLMEDTAREMGEDESVLGTLLRGVWLGEDPAPAKASPAATPEAKPAEKPAEAPAALPLAQPDKVDAE